MSSNGRYMRLMAEAEAWPVASMAAYRLRTLSLGKSAVGLLDSHTAQLSAELEDHLRTRSAGMSLEALRGLREQVWFGDGTSGDPWGRSTVPLAGYLHALAARYLDCDGRRQGLKVDSPTSRTKLPALMAHWRWLSLRLPPDLLLSALHSRECSEAPTSRVDLSTFHLDDILSRPVAETHLHAGAAFSFIHLWTFWMGWLANEGPEVERLRPDDSYPFGGPRDFVAMLFAAAVSRLLLASFLQQWEGNRRFEDFSRFCGPGLQQLGQRASWSAGVEACYRECRQATRRLVTGRSEQSLSVLQTLYKRLVSDGTSWQPASREDILRRDPLHRWLPTQPGYAAPEIRFSTRGMHYLLGEGQNDNAFATVFWQYQRVRSQVYAFLVEEPGTAGLDWFQNHYRRLSPLRGPLDAHLFQSALELEGEGLNLRALELRTSPGSQWSSIRDEVRLLASCKERSAPESPFQGQPASAPELGLLFHFIKERENPKGRGNRPRLHADPAGSSTGFRFGVWFMSRRRQADAIAFALGRHPELLLLLRGLDVASAELATPTWVTIPLIQRLRKVSRKAAAALRTLRPHWNAPPFRVTCHAGEEFRRLNEGLRRIHELFDFAVLYSGDRIGHGLALGMDVVRWFEQAHRVVQPAEERLDDLLWEVDLYGSGFVSANAARLERVRTEARTLGRRLYLGPEGEDVDALVQARRLRHNPEVLAWLGFPLRSKPAEKLDPALELAWRHLTDEGVFRRGQQPVEVWADKGEESFVDEAQRYLRELLRDQEVTIETNPSSNLLIADMTGLEDHPALSLGESLPISGPKQGRAPLLLSINSDDPITFATSLPDEYAHLYFALLRSGLSARDALSVIDTLRENGWRSRFTLPASANAHALRAFKSRIDRARDS